MEGKTLITVLLVDDEQDLLDIGKRSLEKTGDYSVQSATSAEEALEQIGIDPPDVVVADYMMQGADGIELLHEVRRAYPGLPFIIFTGRGTEEIVAEAYEAGADFYIQKKDMARVQFAELAEKITRALQQRRGEERMTRLGRLNTVLQSTNHALIRIHDQVQLLSASCRIAVEDGGFIQAWAGITDPVTGMVVPVASAGHVAGYLDRIAISVDDIPAGRGPTGTAIRERRPVLINDIASDLRMEPWREEALARGYQSSASFPLIAEDGMIGALIFYAAVPDFFDGQEVRLLSELTADISFGLSTIKSELERSKAETLLRESEARYRALATHFPNGGVFLFDHDLRFMLADGKDLPATGLSTEEMIGRTVDEVFSGETLENIRPYYLEALNGRESTFEMEYMGEVLEVHTLPVRDDKGVATGGMAMAQVITGRKQAEEHLLGLNQRLTQIIEFLPDATFVIDTDQQVIAWNRAMTELTGVDESQILGNRDHVYASPFYGEDRLMLIDLVAGGRKGERPPFTRFEEQGDRLIGEAVAPAIRQGRGGFLWGIASPLYDRTGRVVGAIESIRDITDRKEQERALRENEERYRSLFDNNPAAMMLIKPTTLEIVDANPAALKFYGYTHERMTHLHTTDITDMIPLPEQDPRTTIERAEVRTHYARHRLADGMVREVELYSGPLIIHGEQLLYTIVHDITDRIQAEKALAESEEKFRTLFNSTSDLIFLIQADPVEHPMMTEVNRATCARLGYSREELLAIPFEEVLASNSEQIRTLQTELRYYGYISLESTLVGRTGSRVPVEINVVLIELQGTQVGLAVARDITERRELQQLERAALEQIQENLAQMAALNDEIRNPLAVIVGLADLEEPAFAQKILVQVKSINDLVTRLDQGWVASEKVRGFLRKHYQIS
ncbi:PAS domain S-box protein [Methanosphaerula palustris]|uniref:Putative PAS/PAC sensor protein n=1 Tax=Methanosphaerula palustris (strain ATCC BAA-1556 / DSM 19958 / E1-9c) TaxID=521011 RepID=B8GE54_METPE|nr:PAS domain S-box protein [Methanosphaerula palustris]ACL17555.1 putative PAS/PAC sensor protein [Methanosphaerula palustris E1-9c]